MVRPFLSEMELALGAADVAVSRAGASSLAEIAAMRLPSVLIPYPIAADDHQRHNANAFVETGAALLLEQRGATGDALAAQLIGMLTNAAAYDVMKTVLESWHRADAAEAIAERMLALMEASYGGRWKRTEKPNESGFRVLRQAVPNI